MILKKILILFLLALPLSLSANDRINDFTKNPNQCKPDSEEALVCEVIVCNPLGLLISESRSECIQINIEWEIYLATLGPFDSPPKCKNRDEMCREVGDAAKTPAELFCRRVGVRGGRQVCDWRPDYDINN